MIAIHCYTSATYLLLPLIKYLWQKKPQHSSKIVSAIVSTEQINYKSRTSTCQNIFWLFLGRATKDIKLKHPIISFMNRTLDVPNEHIVIEH